MTRYLEVLANHRPFPYAVDDNDRIMFSANFRGIAVSPVNTLEEDVVAMINQGGDSAAPNVDTFYGPKGTVPSGSGPYITILDTGGEESENTHNGGVYERIAFQVVVRAKSRTAARSRILGVWRALAPKYGVVV